MLGVDCLNREFSDLYYLRGYQIALKYPDVVGVDVEDLLKPGLLFGMV